MPSQPMDMHRTGTPPGRTEGDARHREFGRFLCQERLQGHPPFELWRARTQGLAGFERAFALKALPASASGVHPDAARRLLETARRLIALRGPQLAQVVDCGTAPDGTTWVATEYVLGGSLAGLLGGGHGPESEPRVAPALLAHLGAEIAAGLALAHAATPALPHGALTPSNVALTTRGQVKLLDLGLRDAVLGARGPGGQRILSAYAAPELLLAGGASREADLFALGALLYELATGKTPPSARNPRSSSELGRALEGDGVPAALREAILLLVKADPGQRPSAEAAVARLRACSGGLSEAELRSETGALARRLELSDPRGRATGARTGPAAPGRSPLPEQPAGGDEGPALGFAQVPTRNVFRDNPLVSPRRSRAPSPLRAAPPSLAKPERAGRELGSDAPTAGGGDGRKLAAAVRDEAWPAVGPAPTAGSIARPLPPEFAGAGPRHPPAPEFAARAPKATLPPRPAATTAGRPTPRSPIPIVADKARATERTPVPGTPLGRMTTTTRRPDDPESYRSRAETPKFPSAPGAQPSDLAPTPREFDAFLDPPAHGRTITSPGEPLSLEDLEEVPPEGLPTPVPPAGNTGPPRVAGPLAPAPAAPPPALRAAATPPRAPTSAPAGPVTDVGGPTGPGLDLSRLAASEVDALFAAGIRDSSSELAQAPRTAGDGRPLVLPDPDAFDDFAPESRAAPAPPQLQQREAREHAPAEAGPVVAAAPREPDGSSGDLDIDAAAFREPARTRRGPVIVLISAAAAALLAIGATTWRAPPTNPRASERGAPEPEVVRPLLLESEPAVAPEAVAPEAVVPESSAAAAPPAPAPAEQVTGDAPADPTAAAATSGPQPAEGPEAVTASPGRARRNAAGLLEFELITVPPGAEIWVNGGSRGLSPTTVALRDRHRKLVLVRPGYATYEAELDHDTLPERLTVPLQPTAPWPADGPARISIECERAGQYPIRIDGVETGLLCPMEVPVSAGAHTAEIYVPWRFKSYPVKVEVAAGQTIPVRFAR